MGATLIISNSVQEDLGNSGFVCNMVKSQWIPGQVGEHLGFVVNLKEGTFSVTEKRKSKLMSKLEFISKVTQPTAGVLANLAGCITSMLLGVEPVAIFACVLCWLYSRNFLQGAKSIVMQISFVMLIFYCFRTKFRGEGQTAKGECPLPPVEQSQLCILISGKHLLGLSLLVCLQRPQLK